MGNNIVQYNRPLVFLSKTLNDAWLKYVAWDKEPSSVTILMEFHIAHWLPQHYYWQNYTWLYHTLAELHWKIKSTCQVHPGQKQDCWWQLILLWLAELAHSFQGRAIIHSYRLILQEMDFRDGPLIVECFLYLVLL